MAFLKFTTWDVFLGTAQNEYHAPYKVLALLFIEVPLRNFLCAIYIPSLQEQ